MLQEGRRGRQSGGNSIDGGESARSRRLFGSMMFQRKESSESNSKRCSFGDKGGAEGGDGVRFCILRRQKARTLI